MLYINPNNAANAIVATLTELATVAEPIFVFEFENITTKQKVNLEFASSADLSEYKSRYNEFIVNGAAFVNVAEGQYLYRVTEKQTSKLLENGRCIVSDGVNFDYTKYTTTTNYKAYAG